MERKGTRAKTYLRITSVEREVDQVSTFDTVVRTSRKGQRTVLAREKV